jgi:hypothetical protein
VQALLAPAGEGRVAVLPFEGDHSVADSDGVAELISARLGLDAVSNVVHDSDVVLLNVYRGGRRVHRYVSDQSMLVDWFIDDDGEGRFRLGGVEQPVGTPYPTGPLGADPAVFAPFGIPPVDLDLLAAALTGSDEDDWPFAEEQHRAILRALNLQPNTLAIAYRHTTRFDLPNAVYTHPDE